MVVDIGKMVRDAREALGWSQEQLAEKVGATQSTIDRIESGATQRSRYINEVVKALGLIKYAADYPNIPTAALDNSGLQKVTFTLPSDLIERMRKFRIDYDIVSDDEAARQIIEEGLMHYDHFISITDRIYKLIKDKKSLREAAKRVLGNHPLVQSINYLDKSVQFTLTDRYKVEIHANGKAVVWDDQGDLYEFSVGDEPEWASPENIP